LRTAETAVKMTPPARKEPAVPFGPGRIPIAVDL
jgi:hypothetical protein